MKNDISDEALASDMDAQLKIIRDAYASRNQDEIEQALNRVSRVRRMKAKGLYDLYRDLSQDGHSDGQV
ncbi:hypothetical protein [uncultured Roseobacter sp.]|uniref:hypothetical protein n=1 Tax=uncultured Roseobacter sp. TaxID=114847 RepID=UPI002615712D|nr:hypothetical protein [uncultured Roseobacter sp.]